MNIPISFENKLQNNKTSRSLVWVAIVSIIMFFAAFTSAYIVRRSAGNWINFELPETFYISTCMVILSSLSLWWAYNSSKKDQYSQITWGLGLTVLLGLAFISFQLQAYQDLRALGIFPAGSQSHASGSFLYLITFLHLLHLVSAMIALIYTFIRSLSRVYDHQNNNGIYLCSLFWHFLTFLWIYLLLFLVYIR